MNLAPYIPLPEEGLLEKCERIKRELQAAGRRDRAARAANDNEREPRRFWWQE